MVRQGVITGKYKTRHQGKVVGSIALVPEEELALIDENPAFELYEFGYVDDVRYLIQQDNLVAINNALQIDLTGQVAAETIGSMIWSGVGGQTAFCHRRQLFPGRALRYRAAVHQPGGRGTGVPHRPDSARRSRRHDPPYAGGLRGHRARHRPSEGQVAPGARPGAHLCRPPRLPRRIAPRGSPCVQRQRVGCRQNRRRLALSRDSWRFGRLATCPIRARIVHLGHPKSHNKDLAND